MSRSTAQLVIDARPRGPVGPLAGELIQGRSVLAHLVDLALALDAKRVVIHARHEDHARFEALLGNRHTGQFVFSTGPPTESALVLRTDRLYDLARLRRAVRRGNDPEVAVLWRLDQPHGLTGADAELTRRQSYQPLGRYWALEPARALARYLQPTRVRPNALTAFAAGLMLAASALIAFAPAGFLSWGATALALALALVVDTADGHLARLQGTASEFGRWFDASLDELADMVLHAAIAWGVYSQTGQVTWLVLGMLYAMGKYLFVNFTLPTAETPQENTLGQPHVVSGVSTVAVSEIAKVSLLTRSVRLIGHADLRWHLWIVLAVVGRLDIALAAYAAYFPARALAVLIKRGIQHA